MLMMDSLKLEQLKRHYKNKTDAIKHAIINELNRTYNTHYNMYGTRRFLYVQELVEIDDYFKVEVVFIDYLVSGPMEDVGIYYIHKEAV